MRRKKTLFERITGSIRMSGDDYDDLDFDLGNEDDAEENSPSNNSDKYFDSDYQSTHIDNDYNQFNDESIDNWQNSGNEKGELSVDMFEIEDEIIIQAIIAGVKKEDIEIDVAREKISIEGHREKSFDIGENHFYNQELYWGSFGRTLILPDEIEIEEAEATENHGLLTIRLPKLDKAKSTKLKIRKQG